VRNGLPGEESAMKKILVVDDEERIRFVFEKILAKEGYDVVACANANDARERMLKDNVDLVLLDICMPGIEGDVFYDVIKTFHHNAKVIVSSVYPIDEQRQRIPGAVDYFDKSEGLQVLLEKIRRHLGQEEKRQRVVIIDDESKIRILYSHLFEREGFLPVAFSDNLQAMNYLEDRSLKIDLIVLDLAMPRLDGSYFFEIIRHLHPETKVLVASAYPLETQEILVFDADGYFDKADGNAALLKKARDLINQSIHQEV
jgi:DNA-binding NtrC family response regulator